MTAAWTTRTDETATRMVGALAELGDFLADNADLYQPPRADLMIPVRAPDRGEAMRILRQYAAALETQVEAHVAESGATHHSVTAIFGPINVRLFWIDHSTQAADPVDAHAAMAMALLTPDVAQLTDGDPR